MQIQKYELEQIGKGNFSTVYRAKSNNQQSTFALKIMNSHRAIARKQAEMLRRFNHPNIIKFIKYLQDEQGYKLYMEYLPIDALTLYESEQYGLKEEQVKCILFQVAFGLSYIHRKGIIHRDIKPQNILIDKSDAIIKLIDFGLAVPQQFMNTDYIATRWYRAPENILATRQYSTAIDIFSLGCVIVQLYLGNPLFPGLDNIDQIYRIFNILGYPDITTWPKGVIYMQQLGIARHRSHSIPLTLQKLLSTCNQNFIDLIQKMLVLNPLQRITSKQIVTHPYFDDIKDIIPPQVYRRYQEDILKVQPQKQGLSFRSNISKYNSKTTLKQTKNKQSLRPQEAIPRERRRQSEERIQDSLRRNSKDIGYNYTERDSQRKKQILTQINERKANQKIQAYRNSKKYQVIDPIGNSQKYIQVISPTNIQPNKPNLQQSSHRNFSVDKTVYPNLPQNQNTQRQSIHISPLYSPKYNISQKYPIQFMMGSPTNMQNYLLVNSFNQSRYPDQSNASLANTTSFVTQCKSNTLNFKNGPTANKLEKKQTNFISNLNNNMNSSINVSHNKNNNINNNSAINNHLIKSQKMKLNKISHLQQAKTTEYNKRGNNNPNKQKNDKSLQHQFNRVNNPHEKHKHHPNQSHDNLEINRKYPINNHYNQSFQVNNQKSMKILQPFSPTSSPRISIDMFTRN